MKKIIFYTELFMVGGRERVILNIIAGLKSLGIPSEILLDDDKCSWDNAHVTMLTNHSSFLSRSFFIKDAICDSSLFVSNLSFSDYNDDVGTYANTHEFIGFLYHPEKILSVCHTSEASFFLSTNKKLSHYLNTNILGIISICKAIEEIIKKDYGLGNTRVVYNSIDVGLIEQKMNEELDEKIDYKYILTVGRLAEEKNFSSLIQIYNNSKLKNSSVKLVIVGAGYEEDNLHKLISKLNLKNDVKLLGNKSNPFKYMKRALFLVLSSKFEGFGMVLAECLATGTPVVSYDLQTGPNEIIVHEYNGLLVENQNEQKLTEAIDRLYSDKVLYEKCKNNAQESVKKFDVNVVIKEWETLINDVSNNKEVYKLKTDDVNYKNPHGEFTTQELLYYINCVLSYRNIVEYFEESIKNNQDIKKCEENIYDVLDRYCNVFKCSKDVKEMIEINIASNIIVAIKNCNISENIAHNVLVRSLKIFNENKIAVELLISKNDVYQTIRIDKWYQFSSLSKKEKLKVIVGTLKDYFSNYAKKINFINNKIVSIKNNILG